MKSYLKYILILVLFFIATPIFGATCGVTSTGGNWNSASTWFDCGGSFPAIGDSVIATSTSGNLVINTSTNALASIDFTGYTGTLSGASNLNLRGATSATSTVLFSSGMTITWTGGLNLQGTSGADFDLTTNGKTLVSLGITTGITELQDNLTFRNIKTTTLSMSGGTLDMNGKTISGDSSVNRVLVASSVLGTQRTIFREGGAFANADFRDIDLESAYDASAITGLSGDAGGNSADFTFTSATTTYWVGNSGNVSATAEWSWGSGLAGSTSRVPLPQDNCIFDGNSFSGTGFTVTHDMFRSCANLDFSDVGTDNPAWTPGTNIGASIYGSVTFDSGMTIGSVSGSGWGLAGRGSHFLDMQGVSNPRPFSIDAYGGTYTLLSAFASTNAFSHLNGTIDADIYNVTATSITISGGANSTINMGSGTWTITGTGTAWSRGASTVINAETSTIDMSNTTATAKTFAGGGATYNNVILSGQNITITGSNTFNTLSLNHAGYGIGTKFTTATNQTVSNFTTNGSAGNLVYASSTAATNATLTKAGGGTVCLDYISIKDLTGSPTSTWYAGTNSTDGGDNTNWTFTDCPAEGGASVEAFIIWFNEDE